jgi:hypothetical protein
VALLRFEQWRRKAGFNPDQPRVPAGNPDGGQWTNGVRDIAPSTVEEEQEERVQFAQLGGTLTDADGVPYYRPGGHHEMPQAIYKNWDLQRETRKIFDESSTGKVGATLRLTPDGVRQGNVWDGDGGLHRAYNEAVKELSDRFLRDRGLRSDASDMTPDYAHALLKQIRESEDPRIRDFNHNIRRIQRLRRLRSGADD